MNTPSKEFFHEMFDYMGWADRLMIEAARTVADDAYYKDQGISFGSVHKLMVHCMAAQWIWLSRWRGENPTRLESHEQYPTRDSLEQRWPLVHSALVDFLGLQSTNSLSRVIDYKNTKGEHLSLPLGDLMLYVVDHATYHRGQIASMIKRAGGQPAAISYHRFALERGAQS
jgi:uncharacterized damage-inducible protein DinB